MYVPALARAHLAAESVISANKVSLGLKGVAGDQWGRAKGDASSSDLPFARATHTHVYIYTRARASVRSCTRTHVLAAVASLEQGGIIRSATINPNDDDAVMTLSRTSFQATSVTLRAHLPLFSRSVHSLARRLFVPLSIAIRIYPYFYIYLYSFPSPSSVSIFGSLSRPFFFVLTSRRVVLSNSPTSSLPILFKLLVLTTTVYSEVGSYPVSTTIFPARFVNNSSRPLRRVAIASFVLWTITTTKSQNFNILRIIY